MVFLWWGDLRLCDFVSGVWRVDVVELVEAGVPSFDVDVGAVVGSHDAVFVFHRSDGFEGASGVELGDAAFCSVVETISLFGDFVA